MKRNFGKVFITTVICGTFCGALTGCNKDMFDTHYTFNKAMCYGDFDGDGVPEWTTFNVKQWKDFEDGDSIQIETDDGDVYLFHASNCTLIKD